MLASRRPTLAPTPTPIQHQHWQGQGPACRALRTRRVALRSAEICQRGRGAGGAGRGRRRFVIAVCESRAACRRAAGFRARSGRCRGTIVGCGGRGFQLSRCASGARGRTSIPGDRGVRRPRPRAAGCATSTEDAVVARPAASATPRAVDGPSTEAGSGAIPHHAAAAAAFRCSQVLPRQL